MVCNFCDCELPKEVMHDWQLYFCDKCYKIWDNGFQCGKLNGEYDTKESIELKISRKIEETKSPVIISNADEAYDIIND
jgi:Zn-finger nucleic acid-binding protein